MPKTAPFTRLCQAVNNPRDGRADLHMHSTASDGAYSPAQLVDLARRTGLSHIALTDHDTIAGLKPARAAAGNQLELIAGVEISAEDEGREFHLLAYFFNPENGALNAALDAMRVHRIDRFRAMVGRLRDHGISIDDEELPKSDCSLGRRNLANLLFETGRVGSVREAFDRYLADDKPACAPKMRLPLSQAIQLVRSAGGITSCAHPRADLDLAGLRRLAALGLQAVEAEYPSFKRSRIEELRRWARLLGLAITGGSDCHGPDDSRRAVGTCTLTAAEMNSLREVNRMALTG